MGKDQEFIQFVRNADTGSLQKLLQKTGKTTKNKHKGSTKRLNINFQDADGMSGLHQAALMGNTEIMGLLLENGAAVDLKDNKGMVALHYAAWQGKSEPVYILLQWKSPVNELAQGGETPLHLACQHGHFDVVNLLLLHQASPLLLNKDMKTPLDLACEFGRYRVVDLLLRSNLCSPLLTDSPGDMRDKKTTFLHLAAKNGHQDIIRLLLQAGVNVNRSTLQGTCLHEAALFGKTDVVKLLLDCGVDVNKANSYDQTALDIVNKFTTSGASKEIKRLLKEASFTVQAKAVKDHCNIYDPSTLTFKEGDLIKVVEQRQDGIWKGCLMKEGRMAKTGFFPANHVVLIDNNALRKNAYQINSSYTQSPVQSDQPDVLTRSASYSGTSLVTGGIRRNSYGSVGQDDSFPPPPSPLCMSKFKHEVQAEPVKDIAVLPPPPPPSYNTVVNNLPHHQVYNGKVVVNHVGECYVDGLLEPSYQNTGWDMRSSSPCKDSPAGSNRNSAASSDSGRGLSTNYLDPKVHHNYVNVQVNNHHRLSGTSYESGVSSRQSYHSTSSSSVGSLDRLEESGYSSQINVAELFQAGVPDHEVLRAWLNDLHYDEYYHNFIQAGYDMPTITHMTPQDLTAIGISKPGHRKKLKAEIARLNLQDGIPDFKPNELYDWLKMLNLEMYYNTLANQGYDNIDYVTDIMWEDLEEIGIQKLGHQKKIMLAIDRLKRITSGSKRLSTMDGSRRESTEVLEPPGNNIRWSGERSSPPPPAPPQYNELPPYLKPRRSSSGDSLSTNSSGEMRTVNQPLESEYANTSNIQSKPDVVAIQVKRSMSQSTPNGLSEGREPASHPKMCQSFHAPPDRTSDYSDRESTPTGDDSEIMSRSPVGIAPMAPRAVVKPKPVAKIVAKAKRSSRECSPDIIDVEKHEAEKNSDGYKSPVKNLEGFKYPLGTNGSLKRQTRSDHIYDTPQSGSPRSTGNYVNFPVPVQVSLHQPPFSQSGPIFVSTQSEQSGNQSNSPILSQQNSPGGRSRRAPPPPPKRTHSIRATENHIQTVNMSVSSPVSSSAPVSLATPPPIQQKPTMAAQPQQAFVNCVQSLSERFGKGSEEHADNISSDGEDLPPPPPPVAMDIITPKVHNYGLLGKSDKTTSGEYMLQQRLKREGSASAANNGNNGGTESAFGVKLRKVQNETLLQTQTEEATNSTQSVPVSQPGDLSQSSVHNGNNSQFPKSISDISVKPNGNSSDEERQRKDSSGSDCNASTSSLDSNTLPFANENVGTIKQRTPAAKPSIVMVLEDGVPTHIEETDSVFEENSNSLKRTPGRPQPKLHPQVQHLQQQERIQQHVPKQSVQMHQQMQHLPPQAGAAQEPRPQQTTYNASATASYGPSAQQPAQAQKNVPRPPVPQKPGAKAAVAAKPNQPGQQSKGGRSGDVLSEIDNMLQGLTDELDAMLEFELQDE